MNEARLITRNLRFFAWSHLGTLLGALIGTAVLVGALAVGDSVRESLRSMALSRLGKTEHALMTGDRFFRAELAQNIAAPPAAAAALLQGAGTAANQEGTARANRVQVLGIDDSFWKFAQEPPGFSAVESGAVVLNERLAEQLRAGVGDEVVLRVHKPSLLSRESPISPQEDFSTVMRLKVQAIVGASGLGNFSLQANQVPPFNAFVSREALQGKLDLKEKVNLLITDTPSETDFVDTLQSQWRLADAELELRALPETKVIELRSPRIFLDNPVSTAASGITTHATAILTYFVNEFRVGEKTTPYSMITAAQPPLVPAGMRNDEILINEWLAGDLQARAGDELRLRYFVVGDDQRLVERTNVFRVRGVVPMDGVHADRQLMPEFPGISKAEKTEDWDAGFPIDMTKIRPRDEAYWKQHRGTPKAFVTLAAGQAMWANRFGNLTAIRFPGTTNDVPGIESQLLERLEPASIGFTVLPVRAQALAASSQAQDFGQLFLGFSFFIITAAIILMALLYAFSIEQRSVEIGTMLGLGLRPRQVRRIFLLEGAGIALLGGLLGAGLGVLYAKAMLRGLTSIWRSAVGTSALSFHVSPPTLLIGGLAGALIATVAIWLVLRKQARGTARELLAEGANTESISTPAGKRAECVSVSAAVIGIGLVVYAIAAKQTAQPGIFFGAGVLLLIAGLAGASAMLKRVAASQSHSLTALSSVGMRNATRRRKRSIATISLLASGCFLVIAVSAFRLDTGDVADRHSGTGGFELIGESTLPVVKNLNTESGRDFFGLSQRDVAGVEFVQMRVRDGDDASCLNLNRAQKPRLLGVDPSALQSRNAFRFTKVLNKEQQDQSWLALKDAGADEIPAVADAASIQWALKMKVGDTMEFTDERGNRFKIRIVGAIANSILQGSLVIDEAAFIKRFPGETGYRMFLIDTPSNAQTNVSATLSRALRDAGLELTPTPERLAAFNAVQNTYLSTFQILGGLGLLLGTAGLGIVVLRNVLERRGELAVLVAVGFRRRSLDWLVISEHAALLMIGLVIGLVAAAIAILPALLSEGERAPVTASAVTFAAILVTGWVCTWLATKLALRGELLKALRNE